MDSIVGPLVLVGLTVVFVVLCILIGLVLLFGMILNAFTNKSSNKKTQQTTGEVALQSLPKPAICVESGVSAEVVAAISAAVSIITEGKSYKIRSIKRVKEARSTWSMAGVSDNTRSF